MVNRRADVPGARQARALQWVGYWLMFLAVLAMTTLFFLLPLPKSSSDHSFPHWTYTLGRTTIGVFAVGLLLSFAPAARRVTRRVSRRR